MKTQYSCDQTRLAAGSKLVMMHKDSLTISKKKPKVRIIHIVAPEIIKTDVDNFRGLVQRLTGKPLGKGSSKKVEKNMISSQGTTTKKKKKTVLQKTEANANANAFFSFLGNGFMHGMKNDNNHNHEFPLLQFSSSSFGHMPLC